MERDVAHDVLMEKNLCENAQAQTNHQVGQGFMLQGASNITLRNNIIKAFVGINATESCTNITLINNTIINDLSLPTEFSPAGATFTDITGLTIKNNIFYDQPSQTIFLRIAETTCRTVATAKICGLQIPIHTKMICGILTRCL